MLDVNTGLMLPPGADTGRKPLSKQMTLATGVVLKLKPVQPLLVNAAVMRLPVPTPPIQEIPDKGVSEPNPDHPDYIAALGKYQEERTNVMADVLFGLGTEVVSLPEGFSGWEDAEWYDAITTLAGIPLPQATTGPERLRRYVAWVRYYAVATSDEYATLFSALTSFVAVPEVEVAKAAATFPDRAPGDTDS